MSPSINFPLPPTLLSSLPLCPPSLSPAQISHLSLTFCLHPYQSSAVSILIRVQLPSSTLKGGSSTMVLLRHWIHLNKCWLNYCSEANGNYSNRSLQSERSPVPTDFHAFWDLTEYYISTRDKFPGLPRSCLYQSNQEEFSPRTKEIWWSAFLLF